MLEAPAGLYSPAMQRDSDDVGPPLASAIGYAPAGLLPAGLDPGRVVEALRPFVTDRRAARIERVLAGRTLDLVVVLDRFHDPHNASAVLRSCEAHGVQAVHVAEGSERFVVSRRIARGVDGWLTIVRWRCGLECVRFLRAEGYTLLAACQEGGAPPAEAAVGGRAALVLGNEHDGISPALLRECDRRVTAPMLGFVESLNVSAAAAIMLAQLRPRFPAGLPAAARDALRALWYLRSVDGGELIARRFAGG